MVDVWIWGACIVVKFVCWSLLWVAFALSPGMAPGGLPNSPGRWISSRGCLRGTITLYSKRITLNLCKIDFKTNTSVSFTSEREIKKQMLIVCNDSYQLFIWNIVEFLSSSDWPLAHHQQYLSPEILFSLAAEEKMKPQTDIVPLSATASCYGFYLITVLSAWSQCKFNQFLWILHDLVVLCNHCNFSAKVWSRPWTAHTQASAHIKWCEKCVCEKTIANFTSWKWNLEKDWLYIW